MRKFKEGDRLMPNPDKKFTTRGKDTVLRAMGDKGYVTMDVWVGAYITFKELGMRTGMPQGIQQWNPDFFVKYKPKDILGDDLFTL